MVIRLCVRITHVQCFLADDYLAVFAWTLLLISACIWHVNLTGMYELVCVSAGEALPSRHYKDQVDKFLVSSGVALIMYFVGLWAVKVSFLLFFHKLGNHILNFKRFWWGVTVFTVVSGALCVATIQHHCLLGTIEKISRSCSKSEAILYREVFLYTTCAADVLTDILIVSIPISLVWRVRVSTRVKLIHSGLLSLVLLTMVVAIARAAAISQHFPAKQRNYREAVLTWLYFWSYIELAVAVTVAGLASFRTLYAQRQRFAEEKEARRRERAQIEAQGLNTPAMFAHA